MAITLREARETLDTLTAVNITVNLPASTADDDYVLVSVLTNGGTITVPPAGWTTIDTEFVQANPRHAVIGKFWNTGDPTTVTVTTTGVTATALAAAFAGVDQSTPVDVISAGGTNSTGSQTMTAASMTTTLDNTLLVYFGGINSSTNALGPGASGMTEIAETTGTKKQAAYTAALPSAGASGTRAAAAAANNLAWTAIMLALHPAITPPQRRRSLIATH